MAKITKRFVESIKPDLIKTLIYWDEELKGFGLVVLPSGRSTYCVQYRNSHRIKRRMKIGVHGHITTEEARNMAKVYLGRVAHGEDLAEVLKVARDQPTIKDLAQDYLKRHASKKRPKSLREDLTLLRLHILPV